MDYIQKIIELGFATGIGQGNEAFKELFAKETPNEETDFMGEKAAEITADQN